MEHNGDDRALVLSGGPLANIGVGTLGILLLALRRGRPPAAVDLVGWVAALCWSRQLANLAMRLAIGGVRGDEARLELLLGLPAYTIQAGTALPALAACVAATVWVGRSEAVPLGAGGVVGSLLGGLVWFGALGPWLLP
jgi:hypothetical protein